MTQPRHQHRQHRLGHVLNQMAMRPLGTIEPICRLRSGGLLGCGIVVWVRDLRGVAEKCDYLRLEVRIHWDDAEGDEEDATTVASIEY
jgi:hypothetical protein